MAGVPLERPAPAKRVQKPLGVRPWSRPQDAIAYRDALGGIAA
jgi:hypothetical protein